METLSDEQIKAVNQSGRFILLACPGSGKTFTVVARLAKKLKNWKSHKSGIAVLSFTNVAHQEISQQLTVFGFPAVPPPPHFLGTIDSFINNYIFLPFGHLVMPCKQRPNIVGTSYNPWKNDSQQWSWKSKECYKSGCKLTDFTYNLQGYVIHSNGERKGCPESIKPCIELKKKFRINGYATQADANYWGMRVLEKYPHLAKVLAHRFPELIVDEAQDTSETQMRIIDLLAENGLSEIMLVGDPDQAIFEWRDAKPEIFTSKENAKNWNGSLKLTENRRSSQSICNATFHFSKFLQEPSVAVGNDADFPAIPCVIEYDPENLPSIISSFRKICSNYPEFSISPSSAAILVRTNDMIRKILGLKEVNIQPWKSDITKLIAKSVYYFESRDIKQALSHLEAASAKMLFGDKQYSKIEIKKLVANKFGEKNWRIRIWQLLKQLPTTELPLDEWEQNIRPVLEIWLKQMGTFDPNTFKEFIRFIKYERKNGEISKEFLKLPLITFLAETTSIKDSITVETVHAAKGKTFEAVMYAVDDIKRLSTTEKKEEEIRITYVAITRPRKILAIAVPKGTNRNQLDRIPEWMKQEMSGQLPLFV